MVGCTQYSDFVVIFMSSCSAVFDGFTSVGHPNIEVDSVPVALALPHERQPGATPSTIQTRPHLATTATAPCQIASAALTEPSSLAA